MTATILAKLRWKKYTVVGKLERTLYSSAPRSTSAHVIKNQRKTESARQLQQHEQDALMEEAAALTRSLYRLCVRSVRVIRYGNENDEKEFTEREERRLNQEPLGSGGGAGSTSSLSMLSILPPVDRQDELRSRAEYYLQYAREQFVQESDCLPTSSISQWKDEHVARYLFHLRRGEEHRRWLLRDMKFEDPYQNAFDQERISNFEAKALRFCDAQNASVRGTDKDSEDAAFDDDDDDDVEARQGLPSWYKNPRSQ